VENKQPQGLQSQCAMLGAFLLLLIAFLGFGGFA
jgi:hypothetical protein